MKIKSLFCLFTLVAAVMSLSSCANTAKGFGQDLQQSGKSIVKTVDQNQNNKHY